ncbi:MAG: HD domain-containing protein [Clostridia bacterium]|nr:HD domain-containing protein [Clostridia bacterium]
MAKNHSSPAQRDALPTSLYGAYLRSYALDPERDRAFFDLVGDLYFSDEVQYLKRYEQHSSINRLDHVRSVTYVSYVYAIKMGLDVKAAVRGAVLHDLFYYDWHDSAMWHRPHGFLHPRFALHNARLLNPAISKKEENIIRRHMFPLTPTPPRYAEGWVVSLSDKYCATVEMLRAEVGFFGKRFADKLAAVSAAGPDD